MYLGKNLGIKAKQNKVSICCGENAKISTVNKGYLICPKCNKFFVPSLCEICNNLQTLCNLHTRKLTHDEYKQKKKEQRQIYISRVFANVGGVDPDTLYREANRKFNKDYPKYK